MGFCSELFFYILEGQVLVERIADGIDFLAGLLPQGIQRTKQAVLLGLQRC